MASDRGEKGDEGTKGDRGDDGTSPTISIGTVTTGVPGSEATVENVGTSQNVILNITIPRGIQGQAGDGAGDMLASTYDVNNNGVVDNSEKLEGHPASDFASSTHNHDGTYLKAHPVVAVNSDTTSTATPSHGDSFTVIDTLAKDGNGHVTRVNLKTVTLPAGDAHPTGDGNLHVPATGTTNNKKLLQAGSTASSASWQPASAHGHHVPEVETASNNRFLRNDGTWQDVTPENIGAAGLAYGKVPAEHLTALMGMCGGTGYTLEGQDNGCLLSIESSGNYVVTVP